MVHQLREANIVQLKTLEGHDQTKTSEKEKKLVTKRRAMGARADMQPRAGVET